MFVTDGNTGMIMQKCHYISKCCHVPRHARVWTIKILGVTISDHLSVNQHVTNVIASSAQAFHALRVLRAHGLNNDALDTVFTARQHSLLC